jgi:microcystin-dependent protein
MADCYLGEIRMFGGNYAPHHWSRCYGSIIPIQNNEALFSLIGSTYGGDGRTNFALPDMRSRVPVSQGMGAGLTNRIVGQMFGRENITLSINEIPSHNHPLCASTSDALVTSPVNAVTAKSFNFYDDSPGGQGVGQLCDRALLEAGQDNQHTNIMPVLSISFIISLYGAYPSRS